MLGPGEDGVEGLSLLGAGELGLVVPHEPTKTGESRGVGTDVRRECRGGGFRGMLCRGAEAQGGKRLLYGRGDRPLHGLGLLHHS